MSAPSILRGKASIDWESASLFSGQFWPNELNWHKYKMFDIDLAKIIRTELTQMQKA